MDNELTLELCDRIIPLMESAWDNRLPRHDLRELRFVSGVAEMAAFPDGSGWTESERELADVIITATIAARVLRINLSRAVSDKLDIVLTRGWKQVPT